MQLTYTKNRLGSALHRYLNPVTADFVPVLYASARYYQGRILYGLKNLQKPLIQ